MNLIDVHCCERYSQLFLRWIPLGQVLSVCLREMSRGEEILPYYMGYIGMCRYEGYVFQAIYCGIRYINKRVWIQKRVSFSRKLINWLKPEIATQKYKKIKSASLNLRNSAYSCKSYSRMGGGGFGKFSLVQGSKIQLNQLWYRLRVPGSQWHIPTQKFLKYPSPPGRCPSYRESNKGSKKGRDQLQVSILQRCLSYRGIQQERVNCITFNFQPLMFYNFPGLHSPFT